jgi:hypothetical protein
MAISIVDDDKINLPGFWLPYRVVELYTPVLEI